jgi:hypothetical protein
LIENVASVKERILKKGTGINSSSWIDTAGELSSTTKIQAEAPSLFVF